MIQRTVRVGNTTLAKIGHGLMQMTWIPTPVSDEQAFESIKTSLDAVPPGVKMLLNGAEFYGEVHDMTANLDLIARFFEKYPTYADKAFLSIKGGLKENEHVPDGSPENLRRSVNRCVEKLKGFKKIDVFEPARVDNKVPLEDQIKTLAALQAEGKFEHIGLSECGSASLRAAHAIAPISMVEIEVSPIAYEEETKKVIATCEEFGIVVAAYSPMGKGLLTGALQKLEDLPAGDHRRNFTRFKPENFDHNVTIAQALKKVADSRGVTVAQLAIAWVSSRGAHVIPLPGSSKKSRTEENLVACDITLSSSEIAAIDAAIAANPAKGGRAIDGLETRFLLWG